MKRLKVIVVALIVLFTFLEIKAQKINTCISCRDSLKRAMEYGSLLSNKVLLQDSLLSLRAETIKTLLNNNTRILLQKDSLLQVIDSKNKELNTITDKNDRYKYKVRNKNTAIGFLIIIVVLSVLL